MKVIEIKDLKKNYKIVEALKGVSFDIYEGEIFGLLGVNGAGKTTLIKILSGLTKKSSGDVSIYGYSLDEIEKIKEFIDISPQETAIAQNLTVEENLNFFQELYGVKDLDYLKEIINQFGLNEVLKRKGKTLSGGWQRRLSIAIGLISKPKILFLDEPTLGLDVLARRELWKIISSLKGKMTIILTSHYLEEIEALCDRVAIMSKGNLMSLGTTKEIKDSCNEESFEEAFIKIVGGIE